MAADDESHDWVDRKWTAVFLIIVCLVISMFIWCHLHEVPPLEGAKEFMRCQNVTTITPVKPFLTHHEVWEVLCLVAPILVTVTAFSFCLSYGWVFLLRAHPRATLRGMTIAIALLSFSVGIFPLLILHTPVQALSFTVSLCIGLACVSVLVFGQRSLGFCAGLLQEACRTVLWNPYLSAANTVLILLFVLSSACLIAVAHTASRIGSYRPVPPPPGLPPTIVLPVQCMWVIDTSGVVVMATCAALWVWLAILFRALRDSMLARCTAVWFFLPHDAPRSHRQRMRMAWHALLAALTTSFGAAVLKSFLDLWFILAFLANPLLTVAMAYIGLTLRPPAAAAAAAAAACSSSTSTSDSSYSYSAPPVSGAWGSSDGGRGSGGDGGGGGGARACLRSLLLRYVHWFAVMQSSHALPLVVIDNTSYAVGAYRAQQLLREAGLVRYSPAVKASGDFVIRYTALAMMMLITAAASVWGMNVLPPRLQLALLVVAGACLAISYLMLTFVSDGVVAVTNAVFVCFALDKHRLRAQRQRFLDATLAPSNGHNLAFATIVSAKYPAPAPAPGDSSSGGWGYFGGGGGGGTTEGQETTDSSSGWASAGFGAGVLPPAAVRCPRGGDFRSSSFGDDGNNVYAAAAAAAAAGAGAGGGGQHYYHQHSQQFHSSLTPSQQSLLSRQRSSMSAFPQHDGRHRSTSGEAYAQQRLPLPLSRQQRERQQQRWQQRQQGQYQSQPLPPPPPHRFSDVGERLAGIDAMERAEAQAQAVAGLPPRQLPLLSIPSTSFAGNAEE